LNNGNELIPYSTFGINHRACNSDVTSSYIPSKVIYELRLIFFPDKTYKYIFKDIWHVNHSVSMFDNKNIEKVLTTGILENRYKLIGYMSRLLYELEN